MLQHKVGDKQIQNKAALLDSWYGSWQNLKAVRRLGLTFFTTRKANRLVGLRVAEGYIHLDANDGTCKRLHHSITVKLKKVPFNVSLFKVVARNTEPILTGESPMTQMRPPSRNSRRTPTRCVGGSKNFTAH